MAYMNFHYGAQVKLDEAVLLRIGRDRLRELAMAKLPGNDDFTTKNVLRNWNVIVDCLDAFDVNSLVSRCPLYHNGDKRHDSFVDFLSSSDKEEDLKRRYPMGINALMLRELVRENLVGPEIAVVGAKSPAVEIEAYDGHIKPYCSVLAHFATKRLKR